MAHLRDEEHGRCASCGSRPEEWVNEHGHKVLADEGPWSVEIVECEGCQRIKDARDRASTGAETAASGVKYDPSTHHIRLRPN